MAISDAALIIAKGFRRNLAYNSLCVVIISLGVGAFTAMSSMLSSLYTDPTASISGLLLHPNYVDTPEADTASSLNKSGMPWTDAQELRRNAAGIASSVAFVSGSMILVDDAQVRPPRELRARFTTREFFNLFDVPLVSGISWNKAEDEGSARVAVISEKTSLALFGTNQPQSKTLLLDDHTFRIVGVTGKWNPKPHFYDLGQGGYADPDDIYIPIHTARSLKSKINATISCTDGSFPDPDQLETSSCSWTQLWFRTNSPTNAAQLRDLIQNYRPSHLRTSQARFETYTSNGWITLANLIPESVTAQAFISLGFFTACIINVAAIILVITIRSQHTLGVHRALGARRRDIIRIIFTERAGIAALGALGGIIVVFFIFLVMRLRPEDYYHELTVGIGAIITALILSTGGTLLATLIPALYMARIPPVKLLYSH